MRSLDLASTVFPSSDFAAGWPKALFRTDFGSVNVSKWIIAISLRGSHVRCRLRLLHPSTPEAVTLAERIAKGAVAILRRFPMPKHVERRYFKQKTGWNEL